MFAYWSNLMIVCVHCSLFLVAGHCGIDVVSGTVFDSFFTTFARKQENAFVTLNSYLTGSTKSTEFGDNVKLIKYLVYYDKFNSLTKRITVSNDLKDLASSLAHLSDGRHNPIGHNFQLCRPGNLANLRSIAVTMSRSVELGKPKAKKMRLVNLVEQVTKQAGDVCFSRLERKWFNHLRRRQSPPDFSLANNYNKIQVSFFFYANLCQRYQAPTDGQALEEDDIFQESVEFSLVKTAKLRNDLAAAKLLVASENKARPSSLTISGLIRSVLLEPCREMMAVGELQQTIAPIADLLVGQVIVDPEDYFYKYIEPLASEIKDWTSRQLMCQWLLAADLTKLSRSLARSAHW